MPAVKTGKGHRDDALLAIFDFFGEIAELRQQEQDHYRLRRARIDALEAKVRESAQSWRVGELTDAMVDEGRAA